VAGERVRCQWAVEHPELLEYHDTVWGRPTHNDREIFAAYAQCVLHAGLLWTAILRKRPVFAQAFEQWDIARIAEYDGADIDRLLHTEGMIRNFQKINAIINNAKRFLEVQQEFGTFAAYLWRFVDNTPIMCDHQSNPATVPARNLAADLKRRGFKFAGEATAIGLMQDTGMINDHAHTCFCWTEAQGSI
jgi:DNA-3-methyladenine glycosylase I